jgi:hypothetical protein
MSIRTQPDPIVYKNVRFTIKLHLDFGSDVTLLRIVAPYDWVNIQVALESVAQDLAVQVIQRGPLSGATVLEKTVFNAPLSLQGELELNHIRVRDVVRHYIDEPFRLRFSLADFPDLGSVVSTPFRLRSVARISKTPTTPPTAQPSPQLQQPATPTISTQSPVTITGTAAAAATTPSDLPVARFPESVATAMAAVVAAVCQSDIGAPELRPTAL